MTLTKKNRLHTQLTIFGYRFHPYTGRNIHTIYDRELCLTKTHIKCSTFIRSIETDATS